MKYFEKTAISKELVRSAIVKRLEDLISNPTISDISNTGNQLSRIYSQASRNFGHTAARNEIGFKTAGDILNNLYWKINPSSAYFPLPENLDENTQVLINLLRKK